MDFYYMSGTVKYLDTVILTTTLLSSDITTFASYQVTLSLVKKGWGWGWCVACTKNRY